MFAKIKNNQIVKFPYDINDLQLENPYTYYGANFDFIETYNKTEDAINNQYELVEVVPDTIPSYDNTKQMIQYDKNNVVLENGKWIIKWIVQDLPEEVKVIF